MDSTCENCQTIFKHRADRSQRFCSVICHRAYDRPEATCASCGKVYRRKRSILGEYCSVACSPGRPRDSANYVEKICPGCGETFTRSIHRETEHCSRACRGVATKTEQDCPGCSKTFTTYAANPRLFCSQKCYGRSRDKGGRHYYGANWQAQRAAAIVRDGGACVDCGSVDVLHVHHIKALRLFDGDWQAANELDNLVTVCPMHHVERHGGLY